MGANAIRGNNVSKILMNWVLAYGDVVDEVVEVVVDSYPVCHVDSSQWSDVVRDTNDMVLPKWITIASDEFEGDGEVIVIETNYRQEVWGWCLVKNLRYLAPWSDVGIDCGERNLELSMLNTKPYWNLVIQCSGSIWKTMETFKGGSFSRWLGGSWSEHGRAEDEGIHGQR